MLDRSGATFSLIFHSFHSGPQKKSAEEKRTRAIERETTLPSSRPLASYQGNDGRIMMAATQNK